MLLQIIGTLIRSHMTRSASLGSFYRMSFGADPDSASGRNVKVIFMATKQGVNAGTDLDFRSHLMVAVTA